MTVDVLDAAIGPLDLEDLGQLEGGVVLGLAALDDEPVPEERPGPLPGPGGRHSARGAVSGAQPLRLSADPPADQAVFDAEFVAMVLAEAPWAMSVPAPARTPPREATRARRARPPRRPGDRSARGSSQGSATVARKARRPPRPRPRSPPGDQASPFSAPRR